MSIEIIPVTRKLGLYAHYRGQIGLQPSYIDLDTRDNTISAGVSGDIGYAIPADVFHGTTRRYAVPALTTESANKLMAEILPLAERIVAGSDVKWDGSNWKCVMNADAVDAESEIEDMCRAEQFDDTQIVVETDARSWMEYDQPTQFGIDAKTTDDEIEQIAAKIEADAQAQTDFGMLVIIGLEEFLAEWRDEMANAEEE